ncbi:MAG: hypothetical protein D6751_01685 [Deltaproteobacteria bacterium]|nr:MAG: hypothetical protein D6751_01685 [Deltaproteobacteria bacterium]
MLKKVSLTVFALLLSFTLSFPVAAFQAKVEKVKGSVVSIKNLGQMPPWVKKGALAKTSVGLAKVQGVDGDMVDIKVKASTAKKLKAGDALEVKPKNADSSQTLQGC